MHLGFEHRVVAHEIGDEAVGRGLVKPVHPVDLLDAAVVEHRHAVGHGQRLGLVVRHVHKRHAQAAVQRLELKLHVLAQLLVERAQWFVHQHELRVEHQRARQRHALLLPARHLRRVAHAHGVHLHHLQRARHLGLALGLGELAHAQRVGDVLGHRHVWEQGVVLEHHAEIAFVRRGAGDGYAVETDLTGRRGLEPGQHHQRSGFARTRGAEQREELTALDVQVQVTHHQAGAVVGFLYPSECDECVACGHGRVSGCGCDGENCRAFRRMRTYTESRCGVRTVQYCKPLHRNPWLRAMPHDGPQD